MTARYINSNTDTNDDINVINVSAFEISDGEIVWK